MLVDDKNTVLVEHENTGSIMIWRVGFRNTGFLRW